MPIYNYKCETCGQEFTEIQRMSDEPVSECPNDDCDGVPERVISRSSFSLKGTGWESDGYR